MGEDSNKILDGITVVDVTSYVTGGFATLMLANQGAEVIKIEKPGTGDPNRQTGPPFEEGESTYFLTVNYSKMSVEIDLKKQEGKEILYELVQEADVFIENFRPGVTKRLEIDNKTLQEYNNTLIYCSISGFGETGPWSERPGFDSMMQGLTGIMSVTGEENGDPVKVGIPLTDLATGMWAAFGIVNALYQREITGKGEYIDLAMYDSILPMLTKQAGKALAGEETKRTGTRDPVVAPYQAYQAKDGYIILAAGTERLWEILCEALDREDLYDDPEFRNNGKRVENVDRLKKEIEKTLKDKTVEEWEEILVSRYNFPAGSIKSIKDTLYNEQSKAREMIKERNHSKIGKYPVIEHPLNYEYAGAGFHSHSPALGEYNEEVLRSIGYDEDDIKELKSRGVIGESDQR